MKNNPLRKKLSTDELVKNIFDPLQKNPKTGTAVAEPPDKPADIFFEPAKKPLEKLRVHPGPLPQARPGQRAFNPLPWTIAAAVLFLAAYFSISGMEQKDRLQSVSALLQARQNQLARYEEALKTKNAEAEHLNLSLQDLRQEREALLAKQAFLRKNLRRGRTTASFLAKLTRKIPSALSLGKIILQEKDVEIQGTAGSTQDIDAWIENLTRARLIRRISISSTVSSDIRPSTAGEFIINAESIS